MLAEIVSGRMAWSDNPERHVTSMWFDLLSAPFLVAAGILVLAVLWSIDARVDHLARIGASEVHFIG